MSYFGPPLASEAEHHEVPFPADLQLILVPGAAATAKEMISFNKAAQEGDEKAVEVLQLDVDLDVLDPFRKGPLK